MNLHFCLDPKLNFKEKCSEVLLICMTEQGRGGSKSCQIQNFVGGFQVLLSSTCNFKDCTASVADRVLGLKAISVIFLCRHIYLNSFLSITDFLAEYRLILDDFGCTLLNVLLNT